MSTYKPLSGWACPILFFYLAVNTACSSATDSAPGAAGGTSAGSAGVSAGSGGSNEAGAVAVAGSTSGGSSGSSNQGGAGGMSAQAGAPAGGTSNGGSTGSNAGNTGNAGTSGANASAGAAGSSAGGSTGTGTFTLTSPAWTAMQGCSADNKPACPVFPKDNIGTSIGGANKSPELAWTAGPSGTQSYAIVLQDLTNITGGKPFVHWAMWNIPATTLMLPAGLEATAMPSVPAGSSQKSFSGNGYQGSGKCGNVYEFVLYALPMTSFTPSANTQTDARDGLAATKAPTATLRARSGAPGCTE
jgi:phosphatidylethanolamine-binding protein (PEBP) family uncharacterized protein